MLTSSGWGGGGRSMLAVADRGEGGKICQNLADVICERSLTLVAARYPYNWNSTATVSPIIITGNLHFLKQVPPRT